MCYSTATVQNFPPVATIKVTRNSWGTKISCRAKSIWQYPNNVFYMSDVEFTLLGWIPHSGWRMQQEQLYHVLPISNRQNSEQLRLDTIFKYSQCDEENMKTSVIKRNKKYINWSKIWHFPNNCIKILNI